MFQFCHGLFFCNANYRISSNNRPFGCPIIYTDIYSQCYFVHWHLQQFLIQSSWLADWDAILLIIASNDPQTSNNKHFWMCQNFLERAEQFYWNFFVCSLMARINLIQSFLLADADHLLLGLGWFSSNFGYKRVETLFNLQGRKKQFHL